MGGLLHTYDGEGNGVLKTGKIIFGNVYMYVSDCIVSQGNYTETIVYDNFCMYLAFYEL